MLNAPLLEIFLFATVAGVILLRLYTVLGRRTGHERPPPAQAGAGTVAASAAPAQQLAAPVRAGDPAARGLLDIKLADHHFETQRFLAGARNAYERITTAFAAGDRASLRPLLSDEVYAAFDTAIAEREAHKETVSFTFGGVTNMEIRHAALHEHNAEITLSITGQFISATSNEKGEVVEGDAQATRTVNDVWSFARDIRSRDPGWLLVATSGEPS